MDSNKKYKLYKEDILYKNIAKIQENPFKDNLDLSLAYGALPPSLYLILSQEDFFLKAVLPLALCSTSIILFWNNIEKNICEEELDYLELLLRKKGISLKILKDFIEVKEIFDDKGQKYILNSFVDDKKIISKDNERFIYFDKDNCDGIEVTDAVEKALFSK